MKLLICTQAVDRNDPILGFFHRWIEEFAKHCGQVTVICLRTGEYSLPKNVQVYALGKGNKLTRAYRVLSLSLQRQSAYDAVFVHMNPEYLVTAGWLWRMLGKRIALWYTHKHVDIKLRIATFFADVIFTASKESFRLKSHKVHVMGHGIDTDFFTPDPNITRGDWFLSAGRLTKSKCHDLAIRMAASENKELRIAGDGPERESLELLVRELNTDVRFLGGLTQTQLRDEYRKAAHFIHTSETGSLDKVVLEALACGLPIRTNDSALKYLEHAAPELVAREHSLEKLIPKILKTLS
ncbi:glycosyltransferase [Patescibacteria group bacterium]|nr:glycosyltransferase [Patescibacteria group bacterium]